MLAFWIAYILTRPLGASLGDYLSQSQANGGLGLGATVTSALFLVAILAVVIYLAMTQRDFIADEKQEIATESRKSGVGWQVVAVVALFLIVGIGGYYLRQSQLRNQAAAAVSPTAPLGDLTVFKTIADDMLKLVRSGDLSGAKSRADDLETDWDNNQARLRPMNEQKWTLMDGAIDDVLTKVRASQPNAGASGASLESFINIMTVI